MKVVDQESITQRNSKLISREIQSQSAEKFKANQKRNSKQSAQTFKVKKKIQTISSECGRTPIEGCNPRKILKWIEKSNADFISRKHLTS